MGTAGHRTARSNRSGATVLAHRKVKLQDTAAMQQVQENTAEDCHSVAHEMDLPLLWQGGYAGLQDVEGAEKEMEVEEARM